MLEILEQFLILVQFMTRIPVFVKVEYTEEKLGKSLKYFPLVGFFIGAVLFLSGIFLVRLVKLGYGSLQTAALAIIILELMITGLIHLDGLADSADGLLSYRSKEKMLEIMKDSHIGVNGTVVLILYFFGKLLLISEVAKADMRYIFLYPIISRLSTVINAGLGRYARNDGMSNGIMAENGVREVLFSILLAGALSVMILGMKGIIVLLLSICFILSFMYKVIRKIGGVTGDTMGACLELTCLLVVLIGAVLR